MRNAGRNWAPSELPITTCAAMSRTSGHAPGEQAEIAEQRGDEKGRHEPGVARARARRSVAMRPETASAARSGCHGAVGGTAASGLRVPPPANQSTRKGANATMSADPGGLRHHDRLEMPAIARRKVHGLDHAARDSRQERGGAVDAGRRVSRRPPIAPMMVDMSADTTITAEASPALQPRLR